MLNWCFLALAVIHFIGGQRLLEQKVKSLQCTTEVNPKKKVCYMYNAAKMLQHTAQQACESVGGTLAALDTKDTSDFVKAGISSRLTGANGAWIGLTDDTPKWYDGSLFSWTNWMKDEPDMTNEKCVIAVRSTFFWADYGCNYRFPSICQLPSLDTQALAIEEKTQAGIVSLPRSEHSAESKFRCGQYCLQDPLCGKFNFHPTTLKCALYDVGAVVDEAKGSQTFTF